MKSASYLQCFDDVELAVRSSGSGIPFVWSHSLLGSMQVEDRASLWNWNPIEAHTTLVRYDARGHGNSDGSYRREDYQWERMGADMRAVAESFTSSEFDNRYLLGGISMGAATTLEAALQAPDRVAGMVLVLPPTAWDTRPRQAGIYRRMAGISGFFGAAPYRLLGLLPVPVKEDGRSQLALHTMKSLAQANPLHVQAALGGAALSDLVDPELLGELEVPALVLAWEDDSAHPVSTAEALYEVLPDARDLVICHPSDTSEWEKAMIKFVKSIKPKSTRRAQAVKSKSRKQRTAA